MRRGLFGPVCILRDLKRDKRYEFAKSNVGWVCIVMRGETQSQYFMYCQDWRNSRRRRLYIHRSHCLI
jgi:hypothetical protein